jgi:protein-tyrosine-phosphatase
LTVADVDAFDLVLCADRANLNDVLRLCANHLAEAGPSGRSETGGHEDHRQPEDPGTPRGKVRLLRSFDPEARPGDDEVPDPWGGAPADFDHSLELIERACRGLLTDLATARP